MKRPQARTLDYREGSEHTNFVSYGSAFGRELGGTHSTNYNFVCIIRVGGTGDSGRLRGGHGTWELTQTCTEAQWSLLSASLRL
ncbi:hypothetical protein PoB_005493300 [Plakobranchus ocellatus]|uniref:Uncharacterized protein n=1 Tax=Plakobranchus ocellatus TaxID=259542 RepID=A0AAV4CA95_9GAST|nr:hypothetical protein PoB_005493300 [Plakobranchus ocellatus]